MPIVNSIHINQKIRKLLAIGERFALILLPYVDARYGPQSFTSLKADLCQNINEGFAFSRCLNGTFNSLKDIALVVGTMVH